MPERWRRVPEFRLLDVPAGYEASTEAQVRSVTRRLGNGQSASGQVLAQQVDRDGYLTVKLGRRRMRVSVLVALAFHGKPECRHLNGIRDDDKPENLAWGGRWDNEEDKKRIKREGLGHLREPPPRPGTTVETGLIRLSAAVSRKVVSGSLSAVRKASYNDPLFPEVRGMAEPGPAKLFDAAELAAWDKLRHPWAWER